MSENWPDFPGEHHEPPDPGWPEHHEPPPDDGPGHDDGLWEHDDAGHPGWSAEDSRHADEPAGHPGDAGIPGAEPGSHSGHADIPGADQAGHDAGDAGDAAGHEAAGPVADGATVVGADPDAYADPLPDPEFPPAVDVGPLPEPVDGFPWIDTAGLGDAGPVEPHLDAVEPDDLAGYAGVDLPPDADPWAVLAASPDPATAALARWWAAQPPAG